MPQLSPMHWMLMLSTSYMLMTMIYMYILLYNQSSIKPPSNNNQNKIMKWLWFQASLAQ